MKKRVAIYIRVSTDGQTTENQRRELLNVAEHAGWEITEIYEKEITTKQALTKQVRTLLKMNKNG
ncbi:MAG: recombinase family protein [Methylococcales bacterium]|nr:recombinase family protein [Methylococcales bacterium]